MKKLLLVGLVLAPLLVIAQERIRVLSISELEVPDSMKEDDLKAAKEQKEKGYIESNSTYARNLLNTTYIKNDKYSANPYDSHLKQSYKDVKLAFAYKNIPVTNIIGAAPIGTYIKDKGWTGIKEFFKNDKLGTCSLATTNQALTDGSVQLAREFINYTINNKSATYEIEGSHNSGFVYRLSWYDETYIHEFECAKLTLDTEQAIKMVEFAERID